MHPQKSSNRKNIYIFLFLLFISLLFYFLFFLNIKYVYILLIFFTAILAIFTAIKKYENLLLLYLAVIFILPLNLYAKFPIVFGINDFFIQGGILILLFLTPTMFITNRKKTESLSIYLPSYMIFLLLIVSAYFSIGFFKAFKFTWILRETMTLSFYFIPFLIYFDDDASNFIKLLSVLVPIILLEYILRYYYGMMHMSFMRVVTQQANIILFAFPLLYFSYFFEQKMSLFYRLSRFLLLTSCILLALISMQRSLWLIMAVNIIIGLIIYIVKNKFNKKAIFTFLSIIMALTIIVIILLFSFQQYFDIIKLISSRYTTLSDDIEEDAALQVRKQDFQQVLKYIRKNSFMGSGLGAPVFQSNTGIEKQFIDNSYLMFIHKIGIIGLSLILFIYFYMLFLCFKIFYKNRNIYEMLAFAMIMINYLTLSITSSAMFVYRFNILIGIIFVIIYKFNKNKILINGKTKNN